MTPLEIIIMKMWGMASVYIASAADARDDRHLRRGRGRETTITVERTTAAPSFLCVVVLIPLTNLPMCCLRIHIWAAIQINIL